MPSYSHLLGTLIDSIALESDGWHCCLPEKEWAEVLSSFYVLCGSTFGPDKKYYSEAACPYGLCCLILLHWHSSDTRSTYDGSFIQSTSPWNVKYVLQTFHFNLHKSLWSTHICWQCCCCCQVYPRAQWTQVWFCFSFRHSGPIAVLATSTMGVQGGILLGTLVLMGFFVSEKTDAAKDDSSRLHRWLFQWLHSCIHWNFLTCWRFFISCQRFFGVRLHARWKLELPVCFLNLSHLKNKTYFMQFAISQSGMKQWDNVLGGCAQHTRSARHTVIQLWSFYLCQHLAEEILPCDNTGCWIRVISVFWQVGFHKAGHISLQKIITLPSFPQCPTSHRLGIWVTVHYSPLDYP